MTDIRVSQLAVVAPTQAGAVDVQVSQLAVLALVQERAAAIDVSQLAVIAVTQELPYIKIIPPISLPNYMFSAIPFYVQR